MGLGSYENRVKVAIATQAGADVSTLTGETKLLDLDNWDSLDNYEVAMALEDEFQIEIPDEDIAKAFTTVQSVIDYVTQKSESRVA